MARLARLVIPGLAHHVTQRGNRRRRTFFENGETVYSVYSKLGGLVFRYNATDTTRHDDYIRAGGINIARLTGSGASYAESYLLTDSQGSAIAAADASGAVLWRESYRPYGRTRLDPPANDNNTGYTGHLVDKATGLVYMQARYYDALIGRFYSTDPIGYQDQLNLYAYVANDPVNGTDPTGEFCVPCLGAAVGFVAEAISIGVDVAGGREVSLAEGAARLGTSTVLGAVGAGVAGRAISAVAGAGVKAIAQKAAINATVAGVANGTNTAARAGIQVGLTGETDITAGDVAKDVAIGGAAALGGQALSEGVEALGKAAGQLSKNADLAAGGTATSRGVAVAVEGAANALGVNAPAVIPDDELRN